MLKTKVNPANDEDAIPRQRVWPAGNDVVDGFIGRQVRA